MGNQEKAKRLENMTAKEIFYRMLNLAKIFMYSSFYYCSCDRFQCCCLPNGEENYCFICRFKVVYYAVEVGRCRKPAKIVNLYKQMKEDLNRF